jgi:hypothetical protein
LNKKQPAKIVYIEGKLIVNSVQLYKNTATLQLSINEEVLAINDKTTADFTDECSYLLWYLNVKPKVYTVTKKNGEKVIVQ